MFGRLFTGIVIVFWAVTMIWLFSEKVIPPLLDGDPPDYASVLTASHDDELPEVWRLRWTEGGQDQVTTIGYAVARSVAHPNGRIDRLSYVEFEDLPLDTILSELLGPLSAVMKPIMQDTRGLELDMTVATRMRFDKEKRLTSFDTTIDVGDIEDFLKLRGGVGADGRMLLSAQMSNGGTEGKLFQHMVQLPAEALVEGSLSPRPALHDLHVGQTWTIPVFRPFPPNSPVQILRAEVEKHQELIWANEVVETFAVVYRTEAGSGVHATRKPLSREWVRVDNGKVIRQEVSFSGLTMAFERLTDYEAKLREIRLDELTERLWYY